MEGNVLSCLLNNWRESGPTESCEVRGDGRGKPNGLTLKNHTATIFALGKNFFL